VLFKKVILVIIPIALGITICHAQVTTPDFITETKEDVDVALANPILQQDKEISTQDKAMPTLAGSQLMTGSVPRDFRINQQIYDDISNIQAQTIDLMNAILRLGSRYDKANEFMLKKVQLETLLAEIENTLKTKLVK